MQKSVNGKLINLTEKEINDKNADKKILELNIITNHIAQYRRQKENGGITVSGVEIQTDVETRASLLGAKELGTSIDWKTENGFVTLTAEQISSIATAVGRHLQKCFSAEKTVSEAHAFTPYESIQEVETAFDTAYEGL